MLILVLDAIKSVASVSSTAMLSLDFVAEPVKIAMASSHECLLKQPTYDSMTTS